MLYAETYVNKSVIMLWLHTVKVITLKEWGRTTWRTFQCDQSNQHNLAVAEKDRFLRVLMIFALSSTVYINVSKTGIDGIMIRLLEATFCNN
jgi:uncharacterized membrane protein YczE